MYLNSDNLNHFHKNLDKQFANAQYVHDLISANSPDTITQLDIDKTTVIEHKYTIVMSAGLPGQYSYNSKLGDFVFTNYTFNRAVSYSDQGNRAVGSVILNDQNNNEVLVNVTAYKINNNTQSLYTTIDGPNNFIRNQNITSVFNGGLINTGGIGTGYFIIDFVTPVLRQTLNSCTIHHANSTWQIKLFDTDDYYSNNNAQSMFTYTTNGGPSSSETYSKVVFNDIEY